MCRSLLSGFLMSLVAIGSLGCSSADQSAQPPAQSDAAKSDAGKTEGHHHGEGPHGGTVADWGGGAYHVEFTVDHDKKEAAVYILGSDGKSPEPIKADKIQLTINEPAFQVDLIAQPLEGESEGTSSRFVGQHDNLGIVREFSGTITGEVEGTPYAGEFKEEPHAEAHKQ